MDKPTEGKCVYCGSQIVERVTNQFIAESGPIIIGPGLQTRPRGQFRDVSQGYHCIGCGLKYEFVPPRSDIQVKKLSDEEDGDNTIFGY